MADEPLPEASASTPTLATMLPPPPSPSRVPRRRRAWRWWLGGSVAAVLLGVVVVLGVIVWAVRSTSGSAWLVTLVPQLKLVAPRGSLLGDFAADRIDITLPGTSGVLRIDAPRWHSLSARRGDHGRWLHLTIAALHADRVTLLPGPPRATPGEPATPPASLRLPVEIDILAASVDELRFGAGDDAPALRALRGRIHLGDEGGARHRFEALTATHERASAAGEATIGADPPFAVAARLSLAWVPASTGPATQTALSAPAASATPAAPPASSAPPAPAAPSASSAPAAPAAPLASSAPPAPAAPPASSALPAPPAPATPALPAWQASLSANGPLAALDVAAAARVQPSPTHAAQSLDARARVRPFAAWPLGELRATTEALDLAALASGLPATSLSGHAIATTSALDRPAVVQVELRNARAGRWNEGLLPVQRLAAELSVRPDDAGTLDIRSLNAELGSGRAAGGQVAASGRWTPQRWNVELELTKVRPAALDARAPETVLDGKATAVGTGFGPLPPAGIRAVDLVADLVGPLADRRLPQAAPRNARLRIEAKASENEIELRKAEASVGGARATLAGKLHRAAANAPWQTSGQATMLDFDPAPWWPGSADSLLARGANRLNLKSEFELAFPANAGAPIVDLLVATRGRAKLAISDSTLAGVPLQGEASYVNSDGSARPAFDLVAAGNRVKATGRVGAAGAQDHWEVEVDAPQLARLAPLARAPGAATSAPAIAGRLTATARIDGRWPDLKSEGELRGAALRYDAAEVRQAEGRWRLGSAADAPLSGTLALDGLTIAGRKVARARAELRGSARAHTAELRVESDALPPEWAEAIASTAAAATGAPAASPSPSPSPAPPRSPAPVPSPSPAASPSTAASTARAVPAPATPPAGRSAILVSLEGGLVESGGVRAAGWNGTLHTLSAQSLSGPARTWLNARELRGSVLWSGGAPRASLEPGSAELLGATLRWSRLAWQGSDGRGAPARLEASAVIDPLPVAPLLRAVQPDFGWGGDLAMGARIEVRSVPAVSVDVVLERAHGDLSVTDEYGTQNLGFTDLRFGLAAKDGIWSFSAGLAGSTLGVASGAVTARTSSAAAWPGPQTPIEGVLELSVASLGTWGRWVPAGWRLTGELHASASIGGRFGAPEYTGHVEGANIGVRNFLQGVNVKDGSVAIALQGSTARIEHFTAKGGSGSVTLTGEASFDAAPAATLKLSADRFEMLGRVDRRIVTSGSAALRLDAKALDLDGSFRIDEGLVDFTRSDAPALGDDVEVIRRPAGAAAGAGVGAAPAVGAAPGAGAASGAGAAPGPGAASVATSASASASTSRATAAMAAASAPPVVPLVAPAARKVTLDLRVAMGEKLRIRGRGLDTGLRGELHLASPGGRLAVDGTLRASDGTYQAYGQKLGIDRGVLSFAGPIENPRLDIEATRPNLDLRVGVVVTGTALNPRIRLFSEPDMSDIDKLSWLVLGHASEGVGRGDTALLQRAALALLSGEGPGVTDRLTQAIGLDEISVRQTEGEVRQTIVSLGKQISKRWYVGYEQGLNATTGSWQLIYRIAQRLTVRAQAGGDNSLDLIWTLRWK